MIRLYYDPKYITFFNKYITFFNKSNYYIKFYNYLCGFGNYFNKKSNVLRFENIFTCSFRRKAIGGKSLSTEYSA